MSAKTQWEVRIDQRAIDTSRPWYRPALELLRAADVKGRRVVEFGCGNGEFGALLRAAGLGEASYLGLDVFEPSLEAARSQGLDVRRANFEEENIVEPGSVDVAVSLEVIEHIANAEGFARAMARAVVPGGHLVLSTPNIGWWVTRFRFLATARVPGEGVHLRFFRQRLLEKVLGEAGFAVLQRRPIAPVVGVNFLRRIAGSRGRAHMSVPVALEPWLASNFVWLLRRR